MSVVRGPFAIYILLHLGDFLTRMTETVQEEAPANHVSRKADRPIVVQFQGTPPAGPRAQRNVQWLHLSDPDGVYAEHQVQMRVRYSEAINSELGAGDFARLKAGLRKLVLQHNGWIDPDTDQPMPPVEQLCRFDAESEQLMAEEATAYKAVLAEADRKGPSARKEARALAETNHRARVDEIHREIALKKSERSDPPCCFWDSLSQEEIIMILRALGNERKKFIDSLNEMQSNSMSG